MRLASDTERVVVVLLLWRGGRGLPKGVCSPVETVLLTLSLHSSHQDGGVSFGVIPMRFVQTLLLLT